MFTLMKIYKTMIRPVVTYSSETWTLKQKWQEDVMEDLKKLKVKKWKSSNLHENTHNYRCYMFRSSTILRELV